jgi:hypothetical protein
MKMTASFTKSYWDWSRSLFVMMPYRLSTLKIVALKMLLKDIRMFSSIEFR